MNKVKKMCLYFTLKERDKRSYKRYVKERQYYVDMENEQQYEHYITCKSTYAYRKMVMKVYAMPLFLFVTSGIWYTTFILLGNAIKGSTKMHKSDKEIQLYLVLTVGMLVLLFGIVCVCFLAYIRNTYTYYKKYLLIAHVVESKKESTKKISKGSMYYEEEKQ